MAINPKLMAIVIVASAVAAPAHFAYADMVTAWVVHNGTSTVGGTPNAPTFTAGDNITVMAPFSPVSLVNDGDFVKFSTTLTMNARTTTGVNTLNTQLRFGLFNGPAGAVVANDISNVGFIIEYTNVAAGGLIREQTSAIQTSPFTSPTNIGNGVQDSGGDSIQGANPGPVLFELSLTRNAGKLDLAGTISGTDTVSMNPYLSTYSVTGYSSATFPTGGPFTFNRAALFLGDGVNAAGASLADATVSFVPESQFSMLAVALLMGAVVTGLKIRQLWQWRSQSQP